MAILHRLTVDCFHERGRVTFAGNIARSKRVVKLTYLFRRKRYGIRRQVFFQIHATFSAGDGCDEISFMQQPGQSDLTRFYLKCCSQIAYDLDSLLVGFKICALVAGISAPKVVFGAFFRGFRSTSQETAAQRSVGSKTDAQFAQYRNNIRLETAFP